MTFNQLLLIFGLGLVAGLLFFGADIVRAWENRPSSAYTKEQRAEFEERTRVWQEEFEARNPDGPPISEDEHHAFEKWLKEQVRPALRLTPQASSNAQADGTRLGGPVALAKGQAWPVSKGGVPMEFLAQLDFAELPPLKGFPGEGVLQFFIPQDDDLWGADFDNPTQSDVAVLNRPNGGGGNASVHTAGSC
ncbi:MAG: DUF1963 domain-containing protein [Pseudomonadota bacterium]